MAFSIYQWRLWCITEAVYKYVWSETEPTECPTDPAHTIDPSKTVIIQSFTDGFRITPDNQVEVVIEETPGTEIYYYLPNFCNKCTWWPGATLLTNFGMTSLDQQTWNTGSPTPAHINWIDLKHGYVVYEDITLADLIVQGLDGYSVKVEVSTDGGTIWVEKVEDGPAPDDYRVDHPAGEVIFNLALSPGDLVRATFRKANTYEYVVVPASGKRIILPYAEAHATADFVFFTNITRELWGYNPSPPPTKIMYEQLVYKTYLDLLMDASVPAPNRIPASGGTEQVGGIGAIRGLTQALDQHPFPYRRFRDLKSSEGAELRIKIDDVWPGTFCNIVLKCALVNE